MQRFPSKNSQGQKGKGYATKLKYRREKKRRKILEQIQILKSKLDTMEHSDANEVFLDQTLLAFKQIPGISDEYLHEPKQNPDQLNSDQNPNQNPDQNVEVQADQNQGIVIVPEPYAEIQGPSSSKKRKIDQDIPDVEYHFVTPDEQFQAVQNITFYDEVNGSYEIRME